MILRHVRRSWPALSLLILAALLPTGCSKTTKPPDVRPVVAHYQIDDVAQVIGTTLSVDNGGWYNLVKTLAESLAVAPPDSIPPILSASRWSMPLSSLPHQLIDFSVPTPNSNIRYDLRVGYWSAGGAVHALRDTSCDHLEAYVALDQGAFTLANNGLENGTYGFHAGVLRDSSFNVENLRAIDPDTVVFTGSADDSCYALVHSTITVPSSGLWYFHQNFCEFELHIPKSQLTTNPYPVEGEINWILEVYPLIYNGHDPARTDFNSDIFAEARMTFDGTSNATLVIADTLIDPAYAYRYRVNLVTGVITRLN